MTTASPAVQRARALADELVRPTAEQVDRDVVPRSHLDAWGAAGLLGIGGPAAFGGGGAPAPVVREVTEALAGASGATWFVATQHSMPLAVLTASDNTALQDRLLPGMCDGTVLSGVAIAQLRRPDRPAVTAVRVDGGWRFDGHVGWMSSWGLCDVLLLGGRSPDGEVVLAMVPALEGDGLTASAPLELASMQAARTVTLDLEGFLVADADVAEIVDAAAWLAQDTVRTANAGPHHFGLQRECLRSGLHRGVRLVLERDAHTACCGDAAPQPVEDVGAHRVGAGPQPEHAQAELAAHGRARPDLLDQAVHVTAQRAVGPALGGQREQQRRDRHRSVRQRREP